MNLEKHSDSRHIITKTFYCIPLSPLTVKNFFFKFWLRLLVEKIYGSIKISNANSPYQNFKTFKKASTFTLITMPSVKLAAYSFDLLDGQQVALHSFNILSDILFVEIKIFAPKSNDNFIS